MLTETASKILDRIFQLLSGSPHSSTLILEVTLIEKTRIAA